MKKLVGIFIFFLFPQLSFAQTGLKLTCTVYDSSYSDAVEFYSEKKAGVTSVNNRFFDVLDVFTYPDSYLLSGIYMKDMGTVRYTINRTTGVFDKIIIFKGGDINTVKGTCTKIQNKF
jgi:hypothetical protein